MRLAGIRRGDIVLVNKGGREFYALVGDPELRREAHHLKPTIVVHPLDHRVTYRRAVAREIICHWAKRKHGVPSLRRLADAEAGS